MQAGGRSSAGAVEPPRVAWEPPRLAAEEPATTVWRRVVLALGVELHYQLPVARERDAAIARLIREAASQLRDLPWSGGPHPRLGF